MNSNIANLILGKETQTHYTPITVVTRANRVGVGKNRNQQPTP